MPFPAIGILLIPFYRFVMPGLVPGIYVLLGAEAQTWMAGTSRP
jgi:hypothetical protein